MEEKVLIKSEVDKNKKILFTVITIVSLVLGILITISTFISYSSQPGWPTYNEIYTYPTLYLGIILLLFGIVFGVFLCSMLQNSLVVSNIKISGKTKFGVVVDLPIDKLSAVRISKWTSSIWATTSSGITKFFLLANYEEIYKVLNDLVIERQTQKPSQTQITMYQSNADELKKYKELLDSGIISQEEFEAKKKQLLGL